MPIPIILAVAAGVAGLGGGIRGGVKMKEAKDTMDVAQYVQKRAIDKFEKEQKKSVKIMDKLGKTELEIISSFSKFADCLEKIKNRPVFKEQSIEGIEIPKYTPEEIKNISIGAGVLLGGLGGAALGTAGGFAAAGATTSAVMAFGTASTGTAISTLSGAAATDATLAAIGGGPLALGGGGIAAGTAILNAATLGVGLLVGGVIFSITGGHLSNEAEEAYSQAKKIEEECEKICDYLIELNKYATDYQYSLDKVNSIYINELTLLEETIFIKGINDWNEFTTEQKIITENLVLIVGLLNKMCKIKIVLQSNSENKINEVNKEDISNQIADNEKVISDNAYYDKLMVDPKYIKAQSIFEQYFSLKKIKRGKKIKNNDFEIQAFLDSFCKLFCEYATNNNLSKGKINDAADLLSYSMDSTIIEDIIHNDKNAINKLIELAFDNV